jgi:hypothetical protein
MPATVDELNNEIRDVTLAVHNAQERSEERDLVAAAHQGVATLSARYRELYDSLSDGDKMKLDRTLGRRVTDLRRLSSLLPRIGGLADENTPDRQVQGASRPGERRITGVTWRHERVAGASDRPKVGGEVDAWCGPCGTMTTHNIVAMVGDEPKQVLCQACNSRHNFRTTPARKTSAADEGTAAVPSSSRNTDEAVRRAEAKAEELRALGREVASAAEVREFDPKSRYRVGEVIAHPTYGRGKVETVLRSSMLVRFANGGLKSVMLV